MKLDYPGILENFPNYLGNGRTESASFLMWYLDKYYRLDETDAINFVCDNRGDKGVDGIFVNDSDVTITIFQSYISQKSTTTQGDAALRELAGTMSQFKDKASIQNLIKTGGAARVSKLAEELDLVSKIETYQLRGEYLTNIDLDANGVAFLNGHPQITFVGRTKLIDTYISDEREIPAHGSIKFDITGFGVSEYTADATAKAAIVTVKASELVKFKGIADQSVFAYNVRGPLGNTQVNRAIVGSLSDQPLHKKFPLFHNGITVICKALNVSKNTIEVSDYWVVNGCQSLTTLYAHKEKITDDLRLLVKFIQIEPSSDLAAIVTHYSNNQNGVRPRDFKSNDPAQIRLQNDIDKLYGDKYFYEIKRGEPAKKGVVITNEEAGLLLMAFDLGEPWATHRKYQVFEDKHTNLFLRPEVTADRIIMCKTIMEAIDKSAGSIENKLLAKYVLLKYFLLFMVRRILEEDELAESVLTKPEKFVRDDGSRRKFYTAIKGLLGNIIIDLNSEIEDAGADFDYRGKMRDQAWVLDTRKKLVSLYKKDLARDKASAFKDYWAKA